MEGRVEDRRLRDLADQLLALTSTPPPGRAPSFSSPSPSAPRRLRLDRADAVISHIEVNDAHGVGVLLGRMFAGQPGVLSIRSVDAYGGIQSFGDRSMRISHGKGRRDAVFSRVLAAVGSTVVGRILCVPYYPDDVRTAVALQEIFAAPTCTYLMDDQNISVPGIPDDWMRELLGKSALRLAISPEMRSAYEEKYGLPFGYMPPLAPETLIPRAVSPLPLDVPPGRGVVIGNIWSGVWLERLRSTLHGSGIVLDWYSHSHAPGDGNHSEESIVRRDPPSDHELVAILRRSWFAVVPAGTMEPDDDRRFLARFSLPSRIVFQLATSHVPILLLGSRRTAAARFVKDAGIGLVSPYDRAAFQDAVGRIMRPEVNLEFRRAAHAVASRFSSQGALDWIWRSLSLGAPADRRFEDLAQISIHAATAGAAGEDPPGG